MEDEDRTHDDYESLYSSETKSTDCCQYSFDTAHPRTRVIICALCHVILLLFAVVAILAIAIPYHLYASNPSVFAERGFKATAVPRPDWFTSAMKARHITGMDGGVEQRIPSSMLNSDDNFTASLWLFGDTSMNCSVTHCGWGWSMVNNAAMIVKRDKITKEVIYAEFPVTSDGLYTPQIIPKDFENEGSIWGGGFTIGDEMFVSWTANRNYVNTANGLGKIDLRFSSSVKPNSPVVSLTRFHPDVHPSLPDWLNGPVAIVNGTSADSTVVYILQVRETNSQTHDRDVILAKTALSTLRTGLNHTGLSFWQGNDDFASGVEGQTSARRLFNLPGPGLDLVRLKDKVKKEGGTYDYFYAALYPNWFDGKIMVRTLREMDFPFGKWSEETEVLKVEGNTYSTIWHEGGFREEDSELVLTYCGGKEYIPYFVSVKFDS